MRNSQKIRDGNQEVRNSQKISSDGILEKENKPSEKEAINDNKDKFNQSSTSENDLKLPDVNSHKISGRDFVYDDEEDNTQNIDEDIIPL